MPVTKEELESLEYVLDEIEYEPMEAMDYKNPDDVISNYKSLSDEEQQHVFKLILLFLSS